MYSYERNMLEYTYTEECVWRSLYKHAHIIEKPLMGGLFGCWGCFEVKLHRPDAASGSYLPTQPLRSRIM